MAKKQLAAPATPSEADPLAEAIDRLSVELGLLGKTLDQLREDFSWVTRNGLPVQPIEHVVVRRMALDPCAKDWIDKLVVDRYTLPSDLSTSMLEPDFLDRIASDLKATFEGIAQGQLEVVLTALDNVRNEIISKLDRQSELATAPAIPCRPETGETTSTPAVPVRERPGHGRLF
jgi:hypothetical protein